MVHVTRPLGVRDQNWATQTKVERVVLNLTLGFGLAHVKTVHLVPGPYWLRVMQVAGVIDWMFVNSL